MPKYDLDVEAYITVVCVDSGRKPTQTEINECVLKLEEIVNSKSYTKIKSANNEDIIGVLRIYMKKVKKYV